MRTFTTLAPEARDAILGVVVIAAIAWISLLFLGGVAMAGMPMDGEGLAATISIWTPAHAATIFAMWVLMTMAMMLPCVVPAIPGIAGEASSLHAGRSGRTSSALFTVAYLSVWFAFCIAATLLQWRLDSLELLSSSMVLRSSALAGSAAIAAGLYQLGPAKRRSLRRCRSILDHPANERTPTAWWAWRRGLDHGASCLACCWALMLLSFVAGLMNPIAMIALTLWALAERVLSERAALLGGLGLIGWGAFALA